MSTQKMIEHAEVHNHLYILHQPSSNGLSHSELDHSISLPIVNTANKIVTTHSALFDLWYFRLGHPSNVVVEQLCMQFPYIHLNKNVICDSCHLAKQCKLPFTHSSSKSLKPFDLIHTDIWGPLSICCIQGHQYFLTIVDDYSIHTWLY